MQSFDLSKLKVLLVEEQPTMRTLLRQVLRGFGVGKIYDAYTLETGWDKFNDMRPDLTLIDWKPDFDGLALLRKIRTDAGSCFPQAPVIVISAFGEARHVYQALDAGMTEYLVKPASASQLHARIVAAVGNTRPFIRALPFIGPCRRRHNQTFSGQNRRKPANANARVSAASERAA